ncbi:hypothetical protein MtrunA17_Chr3g0111121 [Medicago truncatula]|uniref:Uncharacterized protein n=1 Tax=Medicago truncatula TaxID=3880 RepID=A0A072V8Y0_MEDTR|nr:hypothetical protein MTR_3g067433 [Medicago truncatula]RHN68186.1 hypothetical protein MtrunA17_Chr3g0111121 [Medicago truncatula]
MSALKKTCVDAQDEAQLKFQNWLKGIDQDLKNVKVLRTCVQSLPCLRGRNPTDFISTGVHPRELDLTFLQKILLKSASTELELLQRNA